MAEENEALIDAIENLTDAIDQLKNSVEDLKIQSSDDLHGANRRLDLLLPLLEKIIKQREQ